VPERPPKIYADKPPTIDLPTVPLAVKNEAERFLREELPTILPSPAWSSVYVTATDFSNPRPQLEGFLPASDSPEGKEMAAYLGGPFTMGLGRPLIVLNTRYGHYDHDLNAPAGQRILQSWPRHVETFHDALQHIMRHESTHHLDEVALLPDPARRAVVLAEVEAAAGRETRRLIRDQLAEINEWVQRLPTARGAGPAVAQAVSDVQIGAPAQSAETATVPATSDEATRVANLAVAICPRAANYVLAPERDPDGGELLADVGAVTLFSLFPRDASTDDVQPETPRANLLADATYPTLRQLAASPGVRERVRGYYQALAADPITQLQLSAIVGGRDPGTIRAEDIDRYADYGTDSARALIDRWLGSHHDVIAGTRATVPSLPELWRHEFGSPMPSLDEVAQEVDCHDLVRLVRAIEAVRLACSSNGPTPARPLADPGLLGGGPARIDQTRLDCLRNALHRALPRSLEYRPEDRFPSARRMFDYSVQVERQGLLGGTRIDRHPSAHVRHLAEWLEDQQASAEGRAHDMRLPPGALETTWRERFGSDLPELGEVLAGLDLPTTTALRDRLAGVRSACDSSSVSAAPVPVEVDPLAHLHRATMERLRHLDTSPSRQKAAPTKPADIGFHRRLPAQPTLRTEPASADLEGVLDATRAAHQHLPVSSDGAAAPPDPAAELDRLVRTAEQHTVRQQPNQGIAPA
jgi:hypothetical protein